MTDRNETLADIVAELREIPNPDDFCPWWADGGDCAGCPLGRGGKNCSFHNLAERIEAAAWPKTCQHKDWDCKYRMMDGGCANPCVHATRKTATDRNRLGNAAKLREALAALLAWCEAHAGACAIRVAPVPDDEAAVWDERDRAMERAKAALAAQPRNCDVGTAEEQIHGFYNFCRVLSKGVSCHGCQFFEKNYDDNHCAILWGQLPYEATAAKEGGGHADA